MQYSRDIGKIIAEIIPLILWQWEFIQPYLPKYKSVQ